MKKEEVLDLKKEVMKNEIQGVFEHQIMEWLTSQRLRPLLTRTTKKTLAETSFDLLIRWYPQVASDGRDSYGLDIVGRLENSTISEKARELLLHICKTFKGSKKDIKQELKRSVHFEHNSPVDVVKKKLLNLKHVTIENVKQILNDGYSVVIITKEEENLLRKKGLSKTGEFQLRLYSIGAKLIDDGSKNELIQEIQRRIAP